MKENISNITEQVLALKEHITTAQLVAGYFAACAVYYLAVGFYRLYLHPLRKIPGPKLAASTFLVEFYYNVVKKGQFLNQFERWHEKYGPVIRITPDEVHLSNPDHYDTIYHVGTKFYKPASFYHSFGVKQAGFLTVSNEAHRIRRSPLSPFFSTRSVQELQDVIQSKIDKLESRLSPGPGAVDLDCAFQAVSVDVITDYSYARSYDLLDEKDFGRNGYFRLNRERDLNLWVNKQFPLVPVIAMSLPVGIVKYLNEAAYAILKMKEGVEKDVMRIKKNPENVEASGAKHKTIFHQLLDPKAAEGYKIPPDEILVEEALVLLGAASSTTGGALGNVCFNILKDREVYRKLKEELKEAFPDGDGEMLHQQLERLPYLTACIKEGLRLSHGVPGRLPRVVPPNQPLTVSNHTIPPGYSVSLSQIFVLLNPSIFPDPYKFDPERWLRSDAKSLEKYFVPFSRGSRQCLGINLAWSEMYITTGRLFRRWEMELHESASKELVYEDFFGGRLGDGEMGVQVRVLGRSE